MRDDYDYVTYFIKNGVDSLLNTYDGNMKLKSLLVFANMISIAEYGKLLFDDVVTLKDGFVVEKLKLRYESDELEPDFSDTEYHVLNMVISIFGGTSAKELSEINHTFNFSEETSCFGNIVNIMLYEENIDRMKEIIHAHQGSSNDVMDREIINGISFYYDGFQLTNDMIEQLKSFLLDADDDSYTVYLDDGSLVIY